MVLHPRVPPLAVALTVLALAACDGGSDRPVAWGGSIDTLPGGAVHVSNPPVGLWETGAATPWRLVPEAEIGDLEGDPETVFSSVAGLAVDERGRILVIDRATNELRFYDEDGAFLKAVGGEGQGPGEYTGANGLVGLPSDSLLVIDQEGARYTILGPEGEVGHTVQRQLPFYGWVFRGGVEDGRVYEVWRVGDGEEAEPALHGTSLHDPDAPMDTIPLPVVREPELHYEAFEVQTERFSSYLGVPFAPSHPYELDGEGGLWFGRGDQFHLYHVALNGDTLRQVTLQVEPTPVTQAELVEFLESETVQRFEERGGKIDVGRIPTVKPYFDALALDREGNLWVSTPAAPNQIRFAVFDSTGRYLGPVGFEGAERVQWIPPVIANGRLYVVTRDELEVNRVRAFRIEEEIERLEGASGGDR